MTFLGVLLMVFLIVCPTGEAKSDSKDKEGLPFSIPLWIRIKCDKLHCVRDLLKFFIRIYYLCQQLLLKLFYYVFK